MPRHSRAAGIAWPISSYMKFTFNKEDGEVLKAEVPVSLRCMAYLTSQNLHRQVNLLTLHLPPSLFRSVL